MKNMFSHLLQASPIKSLWKFPSWQAHRGFHQSPFVENTLEAMIEAQKRGAEMVEFDVQLTKDQVPVLFHDPDLFRITKRQGLLKEITLKELRSFYSVSTLHEVLTHAQCPPYFNIELKTDLILDEPLERKVTEVINSTTAHSRILFSSFNPASLWKVSNYLPEIPRALLVAPDLKQRALREMWAVPFLSLQALHFDKAMVPDAAMIGEWQKKGFRVAVWTCESSDEIKKFHKWGVDSVITDHFP